MKEKLQEIQDKFLECLLDDLADVDRRSPALYNVVRSVLSDHKDKVNSIPNETLEAVEIAVKNSMPFKMKKAVY